MNNSEYERLLKNNFSLTPCPKCGGRGRETVGDGTPVIIAGISLGPSVGNIVICENCGFKTNAHREPWEAIADWNKKEQSAVLPTKNEYASNGKGKKKTSSCVKRMGT